MTTYASTLDQIAEDNRSSGGKPQPGATKAELDTLCQRASDELSVRLPDAYLEFLKISNGLDYNGTIIYATHRVPIAGYDDRFIEGFVESNLEHFSLIRDRLTGFSRLLARQGPRCGLYDHKWALTTSSGREIPAFGGPNQPIGVVAKLARCPASRHALRLAG